ncbi:hypothetical protein FRC15_011045 [Serendipita sp. 397]|nr:hypothetical protein FRC15_011045 [Serendipita sp. 397]
MLKGFHPFDPCRSASKRSNYPCNNMGELDTPSHSEELVRRRIVQKETELIFDRDEWNDLSLARSFISRLLVRDRRKRETVQGTFKHSWIQTEYASLERAYAEFVERGWSIIGS